MLLDMLRIPAQIQISEGTRILNIIDFSSLEASDRRYSCANYRGRSQSFNGLSPRRFRHMSLTMHIEGYSLLHTAASRKISFLCQQLNY